MTATLTGGFTATIGVNGRAQCPFVGPTKSQTTQDRPYGNAKFPGPFSCREGSVAQSHWMVVSSVVSLFYGSRPAAIARFVVAVYVYAVNRVLGRWSRTHVGVEVLDRVFPSVANGDPTTAIIGVVLVSGVEAPMLHQVPYCVLRSESQSVLRDVFLALDLTTRPGSASKISAGDLGFRVASASAQPQVEASVVSSEVSNHRQLSELSAREVLKAVVSGEYDLLSHDMSFLVRRGLVRAGKGYSPCSARFILAGGAC